MDSTGRNTLKNCPLSESICGPRRGCFDFGQSCIFQDSCIRIRGPESWGILRNRGADLVSSAVGPDLRKSEAGSRILSQESCIGLQESRGVASWIMGRGRWIRSRGPVCNCLCHSGSGSVVGRGLRRTRHGGYLVFFCQV